MPTTKEFTIHMEDRPGTLGKLCRALADRNVKAPVWCISSWTTMQPRKTCWIQSGCHTKKPMWRAWRCRTAPENWRGLPSGSAKPKSTSTLRFPDWTRRRMSRFFSSAWRMPPAPPLFSTTERRLRRAVDHPHQTMRTSSSERPHSAAFRFLGRHSAAALQSATTN